MKKIILAMLVYPSDVACKNDERIKNTDFNKRCKTSVYKFLK